jgi:hypothetical protein
MPDNACHRPYLQAHVSCEILACEIPWKIFSSEFCGDRRFLHPLRVVRRPRKRIDIGRIVGLCGAPFHHQYQRHNAAVAGSSWRKRELAYQAAFPDETSSILAVVSAPRLEFAGAAAASLVKQLTPQKAHFHSVSDVQSGAFFARNGLLYVGQDDLADRMRRLVQAEPLIRMLASDPSLRGLARALSTNLQAVAAGRMRLDAMAQPLNAFADTLDNVLAGKPASFSWQALVNGRPAKPEDLRHLINIARCWTIRRSNRVTPRPKRFARRREMPI